MKKLYKKILPVVMSLLPYSIAGQVTGTDTTNESLNAVSNIIAGNTSKGVTLGAYAHIDYNQPVGDTLNHNGKLDVHRAIIFMGYKFNEKTHFVTEIEFEHIFEAGIEQAFLSYSIDPRLTIRAGLLLIPMGIINEYHEPPTYNGVERPNLDSKIVPTTWREIGAGFTGKFDELSLKYQLYAVNGFNGYNGSGTFRGVDGFRKGRQKGAESLITSPNISSKLDYYGIRGLQLGLASYFGKSQTSMYESLDMSDNDAVKIADSTVVGISMIGFDARFQRKGFLLKAQYILANVSNTMQYNAYTGKDLGSLMDGYYIEAGYDILSFRDNNESKLIVFARYENYNTHSAVDGIEKNNAYNRTDITAGLGYEVARGAVFKVDYQLFKNAEPTIGDKSQLNFGVGIWF